MGGAGGGDGVGGGPDPVSDGLTHGGNRKFALAETPEHG